MTRRPRPDRSRPPDEPRQPDDLPTLEALAHELTDLRSGVLPASNVQVTCSAANETGFDTALGIEVPDMDKRGMVDAVAGPLRAAVAAAAGKVRHHRVVVRFLGDVIIGTSVKDVTAEVLKQAKARKVVVRRGYGDELVFEGEAPRVQVDRRQDGEIVRVDIATGDLEPADLLVALQSHVVALASSARGHRFVFAFTGAARPDATVRDVLSRTLADAGAVRVAIGERLLFDRELEARVRLSIDAGDAVVEIAPAEAEHDTLDGIALALGRAQEALAGKNVRLRFLAAPRPAERRMAVDFARKAGAARIAVAVAVGGGETGETDTVDVVFPPLLTVSADATAATLQLAAGGRDAPALRAALQRECDDHAAALAGRAVVVVLPPEVALDEAMAACLHEAVGRHAPASLLCALPGGDSEVLLPAPVSLHRDGEVQRLRVDTDAGKPAQVLRALERWLPRHGASLQGSAVRVQIVGAAAPSRSLLRTVVGAVAAAGVARLEVDDHGTVDVVLPPLLALAVRAPGAVRVAATLAGRDEAQVELALARELERAESWQQATVTIAPSPAAERLAALAVERGAQRVLFDGPVPLPVHPPLLTAERQGSRLWLRATPAGDVALVRRQIERELPRLLVAQGDLAGATVTVVWNDAEGPQVEPVEALLAAVVARAPDRVLFDAGNGRPTQVHPAVEPEPAVRVLGRKDDAVPPLLMLGIGLTGDPGQEDAVRRELQPHVASMAGRRVLLVGRRDGRDVVAGDGDAVFLAARAVVETTAAATLVYSAEEERTRPFFTVVHSVIEGLAVGARFSDPRPKG